MFIWRELGGMGTGCLFQFTYCDSGKKSDRGVATYTQKRNCLHIWTKNMGKFYHSSNVFLILCVQNVCVEAILISQNTIFAEFVMILL